MQIVLNELSHNGTNGQGFTKQRASGKSTSLQAPDTQTELQSEKKTLYTEMEEDGFTGQLCNPRGQEEVVKDATEACWH